MKNYICIDGVKTKLSCETAENLKQRFGTEKPELRCGDYGEDCCGKWIKIYDKVWWLFGIQKTPTCNPDSSFIKSRKGNIKDIFDDLERNSKDLEEWESAREDGSESVRIAVEPKGIWIGTNGCACWNSIEKAQEIGQNLLQMVATAKRKAEKDC